jgi:parallel beta-helix repeat protein/predicted outer membrane repeat protein
MNCDIFRNSSEGQGGAIGIYMNSSPLVRNNNIHDNIAVKRGGAISIMNGSNPDILNNQIHHNQSNKGGGAIAIGYLSPLNGSPSAPFINGNMIYNNSTNGLNGIYGQGGAIFICGSNPIITENDFEENTAFGDGGAIYLKDQSNVTLEVNNFIDNSTSKDGGGIYCTSSTLNSILSCQFSRNTADNGGGLFSNMGCDISLHTCTFSGNSATANGGGIYVLNSTSTIQNCTFESNTATGNGGGVYMNDPVSNTIGLNTFSSNEAYDGSAIYYFRINNGPNLQNPTYILNNLIVENIANNMGSVYFSENNINTVFNHNTVTNNTSATTISGLVVDRKEYFPDLTANSCNFNNNIVYGNTNVIYLVFASTLDWSYFLMYIYASPNCTYITNPYFVSSTDYHLSSSSTCIDAGDNNVMMTTSDLDGNQRINNGTTDYGCFEY